MAERKVHKVYAIDQVRSVIESIGVRVSAETRTDLLCYCPFHSNSDSPAFTISKHSGLYICHNASCQANSGGSLDRLVMLKSSKNPIEAIRFIATKQSESTLDLAEIIKDFDVEPEYRVIPQEKIDVLVENFRSSERAQEYMESRGFIPETASHFEVGYDPSQDMVVVPIHDLRGNVIGVNGRSVQGKRFKLSKNIERNKILFNLHRARRMGGTAIVFESQFDVMKVHQAGFPNGVCFFGSHVSREQVSMLQRYFDRIIIMTDADEAGRKAGHNISGLLKNKKVEWAIYDWGVIYPHGAKDAGDLSEEEIRYCVNNSVSDVAYKSYKQLAHTARV